ncbi:hypothetical protein Dsin_005682 [Dipteronia sinensis]|uniref:Pericentriolar material 1 protein n=1 Tax=Dipteronia sinensis TaxID=43782 RepID=A0AAE0EGQ5_9ROSI|nr:hypothetical protein Dsin_005682 [Dipteronia sinensis]
MDMWVVAAAAAAGCMAKYWQNLSRDRDSSLELSSKDSNFEKPEPSCPLRRLAPRKKLNKDVSIYRRKILDHRNADMCELVGVSAAAVASASGYDGEIQESLSNSDSYNLVSLSSLPPEFLASDNLIENEFGNGRSDDSSGNPVCEMSSFRVSARKRSTLRTKHSYQHTVKPLTSLESCLVSQLYQKHSEMEEYVLSSLPSTSTPTLRPLFVTDGNRIISGANGEFQSSRIRIDDGKLHKESYLEKNEIVLGVPPLPKVGSLDLPTKMKFKSGKGRCGRLSSCNKFGDGSYFHSQAGSQDVTVFFCLGISIGIMSSFIANKREIDKLKEYLKRTENLVQDLQEELEMKDSTTVKELANENYGSQVSCDNSFHDSEPIYFFPEKNVDKSRKHDDEDICDEKAESDSMSKIEAELEAELERMGLNINACGLERRLSDFVELDPDFVADFAQGDLRPDMIDKPIVDRPDSNKDASGTSKTPSGNYAVSPRGLSLRLHEVIQSRLEERVMELEAALENSQRKVELLESEHKNSWKKFSSSELRYSSAEESPVAQEEYHSMAEPLVMNLSGEALDAYNEAYEELMKINDSEEEESTSGIHENNHQAGFHPFDRSVSRGQNGNVNGSLPHLTHTEEKTWKGLYSSQGKISEEDSLRVEELLDVGASGDENSDCDDEMEKQLIKQIVEKTKKGSPVVLNAQRVLFLMDEDEH